MANREIEAKLLLSAVDRTGKAFRSVSGRLDNVNKRADKFNRNGRSTAQTAVAVGRAVAVVGTAVGAVGVASYKKFAGDERTLTRIGITAEATREQMADIRQELFSTAKETGLQFADMIRGLDALTASGRTLEESMALLPSVAVTAQASGAEITDIATSADALFTSLNIKAKDMQNAFDILVAGGKAGKFELKDMAQFLPSLAPAFKALGYEGEEGLEKLIVALQTVRTQTGSSGEAATAFSDVLQKMESQTVTNNFKKFGIDLRGSLSKARKEGEDILDAFIRISKEAVDGDLSKLPQLFTDKQMLIGMRSLITGGPAMERISAAVKSVDGSALKDLGVLLQDNQAQIDRMSTSWDNFTSSFGAGIAPVVSGALDGATDFIDRGDAITEGMKKDGLGFWARISQHGGRSQDDPQMIEWAKKGGFKFNTFEGGTREGETHFVPGSKFPVPKTAPVPQRPALATSGSDGTIPVPRFRSEIVSKSPAPNGRGVRRRPVEPEFINPVGAVHSNFDENGNFRKSNDGIELEARLRTDSADAALDDFNAKAEQPVMMEVDADTSKAEAKIRKLKAMADGVNTSLNNAGRSRDRGRSMPGAG